MQLFFKALTSQFVALVTYVKYKILISQSIFEKEKQPEKKRESLKLNGKLQNWGQISEVLLRVQSFYWIVRRAFYRPDYQKLLMCLLIKRLGQAFASKHVSKSLKQLAELLKHSVELFKHSEKLLRVQEKTISSAEFWKAQPCVCVITRHMLPQSARIREWFIPKTSPEPNLWLLVNH